MDPVDIAALIERNLAYTSARVSTDGQGHYEAVVVSPLFDGQRTLARHRLVYGALGEIVGREIHALQLKTYTPEEWQAASG